MDMTDNETGTGQGTGGRAFEFTVTGGAVTAEQAVFGQHTETVRIPSDATFAVGSGTITETLAGTHDTDTTQFTAEAANANLYRVSAETQTVDTPTTTDPNGHVFGFSFTESGTSVTAEQAVFGSSASSTHSHTVPTPPDAEFTVSGSTVTETTVQGHEVDTTTFTQSGTAGLFAISAESESFIAEGSATTALSVDPFERAEFTFGAGGAVSAISAVHADGSTTAFTPGANETFTQLAPDFVQETITHGSHAEFVVFADGNGDGIYTAIAHGEGASVDLTGLQAQLATIEPFL
ncbi:hypothetical protein [Phenylobacterium sp.]|uniref:hypothetical protein n=1 Tax=Phenylobacterium sp. TaxID=1871053 RepID=UPI00121C4B8F|nr:hypothetical protein [Phenylobacterium sp.]THD63647.1 MAG: hypothetical protein E8A49_04620 [Phenylobacterium sp.]